MSVLAGEERVLAREALPALGQMAALLFIVGCAYVIDGFVRALFGTLEGAVGWIPYAGRVLRSPIHKIEQKVTHALGRAERSFDHRIGVCWHKLAAVVRGIPGGMLDDARLLFGITALLLYLPSKWLVLKLIHSRFSPLRAHQAMQDRAIHHQAAQAKALQKSVAQGVYPRLRAGEHTATGVLAPGITSARDAARAAEAQAIATYKWLSKHKTVFLTGVFTGAAAWALTRLGGGWIRCKNWREIGKRVCRMPWSTIEGLLSLAIATEVLIDPEAVAEAALAVTDTFEGIIERIAE